MRRICCRGGLSSYMCPAASMRLSCRYLALCEMSEILRAASATEAVNPVISAVDDQQVPSPTPISPPPPPALASPAGSQVKTQRNRGKLLERQASRSQVPQMPTGLSPHSWHGPRPTPQRRRGIPTLYGANEVQPNSSGPTAPGSVVFCLFRRRRACIAPTCDVIRGATILVAKGGPSATQEVYHGAYIVQRGKEKRGRPGYVLPCRGSTYRV